MHKSYRGKLEQVNNLHVFGEGFIYYLKKGGGLWQIS